MSQAHQLVKNAIIEKGTTLKAICEELELKYSTTYNALTNGRLPWDKLKAIADHIGYDISQYDPCPENVKPNIAAALDAIATPPQEAVDADERDDTLLIDVPVSKEEVTNTPYFDIERAIAGFSGMDAVRMYDALLALEAYCEYGGKERKDYVIMRLNEVTK